MLLQLPISQKIAVSGLDNLFTAVSALSATGLACVDIAQNFSLFGQMVLLLLIQLSGMAYLVFSSFIILKIKEAIIGFSGKEYSKAELTTKDLIKQAVLYTAFCEIIGFVFLYLCFQNAKEDQAFWNAIFHTASSYCTAGFSLFSSNLENYANHLGINVVVSILSLLGSVGFFLWIAMVKSNLSFFRCAVSIIQSFTAKIILISSLIFFLTSHLEMHGYKKALISFFQVISAISTAGFNTVDLRTLPQVGVILLIILMLYGGCLTGSCLNMKGISLSTLTQLISNRQRHLFDDIDRQIAVKRTLLTFFTFGCYLTVLVFSCLLLSFSERRPVLQLLFEAASALCSVGLTVGISSELSIFGKWLMLVLMFMGRTGILILSFAVASRLFAKQAEVVA